MSVLNPRVSPEPPSINSVGESELKPSSWGEKEKGNSSRDEGKEVVINCPDTNECQEGIDGISATEQQYTATGKLLLNGNTSPAGIQTPKRLSWSAEDASSPLWRTRFHGYDRVILMVLCLMCVSSVVLTLLVLFGVVSIINCPCATKTESDAPRANQTEAEYSGLSNNVPDLRESVTALKSEGTLKNMSQEIAEMRNYVQKIGTELEHIKKKYEQLKGKDNTSLLWDTITTYRQNMLQEVEQLDEKIMNVSKTQGPRGPPGYNGTQGPPGDSGSPGPRGYNGTQGPPGSSASGGDLSLCSYQEKSSADVAPGSYAAAQATAAETNGKKLLGVNCGTNDAKTAQLSSSDSGGTRTYTCDCSGTLSTGASRMYCKIHYWEC